MRLFKELLRKVCGVRQAIIIVHSLSKLDIPITTPSFWTSEECTDETLKKVFRSETEEEIPLLQERMDILREVGRVLQDVSPAFLPT